jgi:hypothetical protein
MELEVLDNAKEGLQVASKCLEIMLCKFFADQFIKI